MYKNNIIGVLNFALGCLAFFFEIGIPTETREILEKQADGTYYISSALLIFLIVVTVFNLFMIYTNRKDKKLLINYSFLIMASLMYFIGIGGILITFTFIIASIPLIFRKKELPISI